MIATYLPTLDELTRRLARYHSVASCRKHPSAHWPVGLHCWPRRHDGCQSWFGVGPVDWSGHEAVSWFDIRLESDEDYHGFNRRLAKACKEVGIGYINMA